jgi:enoyl-CoA hydratase/carnithine racemase
VGSARAYALTQNRSPIGAAEARDMGLIDDCFALSPEDFRTKIVTIAEMLAATPDFPSRLQQKIQRRSKKNIKNRCIATAMKSFSGCSLISMVLIQVTM